SSRRPEMVAPTVASPAVDVDVFVRAYEMAWQSNGQAAVRDHLPPPGHPGYLRVLVELIRVDLEYNWSDGRRRRAADYLAQFPELTAWPDLVGEVAYEEYRQRLEAGELAEPEDYAARYGIDIHAWDRLGPRTPR